MKIEIWKDLAFSLIAQGTGQIKLWRQHDCSFSLLCLLFWHDWITHHLRPWQSGVLQNKPLPGGQTNISTILLPHPAHPVVQSRGVSLYCCTTWLCLCTGLYVYSTCVATAGSSSEALWDTSNCLNKQPVSSTMPLNSWQQKLLNLTPDLCAVASMGGWLTDRALVHAHIHTHTHTGRTNKV